MSVKVKQTTADHAQACLVRATSPSQLNKKKRRPGRPPTWKTLLLRMRWGESIPTANKSEAMSLFVAARRLGYTTETRKQPDGSYMCFKRRGKARN